MVLFSLVNCGDFGGFYIGSRRQVVGWLGPHDLDREIENARRNGEKVEQLSTGLNGDWFLRTDKRLACKMDPKGSASNVEQFSRQLREAGFSLEHHTIQFFTFVPDPTGYVAVVRNKDGSMSRCAWKNIPHGLSQLLESNSSNGIRLVTVGKNGSYVVILNTGAMWWSGIPGPLSRLLEDAGRKKRVVTTVSLSLVADTWYFIEFADGGTRFVLPPDWHDSINRHTDDAEEKTSDNLASSSSSPRTRQPASTQEVVYTPRKPVGTQQPAYTEELVYTPRKAIGIQQPAYSQEPLYAPQVSVATQQPAYSQNPVYAARKPVDTQQPAYEQEPVYQPQVLVDTQQPAHKQEPIYKPQVLFDTQQPAYKQEPVYKPQVLVDTQQPAYSQEPVYAPQVSVATQQPAYSQEPVYAPRKPVDTQQPAYKQEPVFNPQVLVDTKQPAYLQEPVYAPQVSVVTQQPAYALEPVFDPQVLVDTQQPTYSQEPVYAPQVSVATQQPAYSQEPVYARQPSYTASVSSGPTPEQPRGRSTTMEDIAAFIKLVRRVVKLVRKVVKLVGAIRDAT
ncbi:hypothetical protein BC826DRAFT_970957 [Russula brevipes]|nr:hypothetical protein BC826DRAFT_970957 [Russula brevipes]